MTNLDEKVIIMEHKRKKHTKASEEYLHVLFQYEDDSWEGWIPIEYRRTGISIKPEDEKNYLNEIYLN